MSVRTPKPPQRKLLRWRVTRIKSKGVEIGTVEAPDADSAIRQAIKDYGITDREQQKRLVTMPLTSSTVLSRPITEDSTGHIEWRGRRTKTGRRYDFMLANCLPLPAP